MARRIKKAAQRLAICKHVLWVIQTMAKEVLPPDKRTSAANNALLRCAIFIGQAEGRPMTAAKLADYAGMPRPTAIRKLRSMEQHGVVEIHGGKVTIPIDLLNRASVLEAVDLATQNIHRLSAALSKMDGKAVAPASPGS